jgi:hypothetical protein
MTVFASRGRMHVFRAVSAGLLVVALSPAPVLAHEGENHAAPPPASPGNAAPRLEAASEVFELVGIVGGDAMSLFLDRFETNEPVTEAAIKVTAEGETVRAEPLADGTFRVAAPWLAKTGPLDLTFAISAAAGSDLLIATLERPSPAEPAGAAHGPLQILLRSPLAWGMGLALLATGIALGMALARRRRQVPSVHAAASPAHSPAKRGSVASSVRRRVGAAAIALAVTSWAASALAHGDEEHGAAAGEAAGFSAPQAGTAALPAASDSPRRLPDGTLFVPKPTQRLLSVRTRRARSEQAARTSTITGRVIADPTAGGIVQAAQAGRIQPPEKGLPVIGQQVVRGQVLAAVEPAITMLERGGVREQLAQIDSDVAIAEQRVARLSQLRGSVPQREIEEARRELDGLRQRRRALAPALADREIVRASASGVISVAGAVNGQLIDAGEVLFEIVDPAKLWVEAIAYDPAAVADISGAVATTPGGGTLPLELVGRSLTLRQQAVPVQFRIAEPVPALTVGTPVTVIVNHSQSESGIVLPTASVASAGNGESVVFEHVAAERFAARPVRVAPLDGERVIVAAGVGEGARIVTQGAELLNQIR